MATATATRPSKKTARGKSALPFDDEQIDRVAAMFDVAHDRTRLRILIMLADGEKNVTAICEALGQSQPAVSHHLSLARHARIIAGRREGKFNFYSLTDTGRELAKVARVLVEG